MIPLQNIGAVTMIAPQSQVTTGPAEGIIKTGGVGDYLNVIFSLDTQVSTASKPQVLKLQESDSTEATTFVDIPEMVGDGASGFTIPPADTVNAQAINLGLDLKGRKRNIRAQVQPGGATQQVAAIGIVSRGDTGILKSQTTRTHYA